MSLLPSGSFNWLVACIFIDGVGKEENLEERSRVSGERVADEVVNQFWTSGTHVTQSVEEIG